MPNFDSGHYFLTTLAPIRVGGPDDGSGQSYVQKVQMALDDLPTAHQSPATEKIKAHSPFAKSLRTHLCRFVVIGDAVYNGRSGDNALLTSAKRREQPLVPKHIDHLPCAYLMFVVDFDAVMTPGDNLPDKLTEEQQGKIRDDYLRELWRNSSAELLELYKNCQIFDQETIKNPQDFCDYIIKCQIETWMSYHDYYIEELKLPSLPLWTYAAAAGLPFFGFLWFAIGWLTGFETVIGMQPGPTAFVLFLLTGLMIFGIYRNVIRRGRKPLPAPKFGDLPSVLKGLYVQQNFADFAVANQGVPDADLYGNFTQFLDDHRPEDVLTHTQRPGVINSR